MRLFAGILALAILAIHVVPQPAAADASCRLRQCVMPMTKGGAATQKALCGCYKSRCMEEPDECKKCEIMLLGVCSGEPACGGSGQPPCKKK